VWIRLATPLKLIAVGHQTGRDPEMDFACGHRGRNKA
jgi:hypothetical protein